MKKLITTCALLTTVTMVSFAQTKQTSHTMSMQPQSNQPNALAAAPAPVASKAAQQMADRRAKIYEKQYGLSPAQTKGVYKAELEYAMQEEQARAHGGQPGEGQMMQMGMARDMKLKEVMTPEQYTKYEATKTK